MIKYNVNTDNYRKLCISFGLIGLLGFIAFAFFVLGDQSASKEESIKVLIFFGLLLGAPILFLLIYGIDLRYEIQLDKELILKKEGLFGNGLFRIPYSEVTELDLNAVSSLKIHTVSGKIYTIPKYISFFFEDFDQSSKAAFDRLKVDTAQKNIVFVKVILSKRMQTKKFLNPEQGEEQAYDLLS